MEDRIQLSYFYGKEAEQFSFYKIPKLLFMRSISKNYQWRQRFCMDLCWIECHYP